ncbi:RecBCD enzyme subunit RecC [Burkholderia sp. SFA1]|uniref:exodeoxyribonuclease V subunit gamma n=1 Tax=unclassified Caballeronia TaxID=2646786 RepID=UPI001F241C72|nr:MULTISPECIES: exodeoxyribonuclease V subunit gamma [unclassified Caballeronia]MCE4542358.1 exodeoxyribonuclease V subunit gamma [Caballeronia sp. PC1]MCE4568587.1 exodeoxyribonuclease V subunit gamma [Caballeronia sp. CLC5]BBP95741.1 RecBCD enzyme subunit RecC [Burkholderia sp. SFA1]
MLELFYSNRHETLAAALFEDLDAFAMREGDPFAREAVIVPSAALRRRLELDMAGRFGICANVDFCYLAQWLWAQIGRVLPVPAHSPFAPDRLAWRCYRLFEDPSFGDSARLSTYLHAADDSMRYELVRRIATVFDHYLTYRPEWLGQWQAGGSILAGASGSGAESDTRGPRLAGANEIQREDERWQAALWRALLADLAVDANGHEKDPTPPAYRFLADAPNLDLDAAMRAQWPRRISVFALPTMPPLHIALLRELSRWIDVRVYASNPCREFWFDIVSEARVEQLELKGEADYQEVGHPLLAEWGRQTQAQLHMLHELTERAASSERQHFEGNPAPTWLARVQNGILALDEENAGPQPEAITANGIEVHVCHSLSRQLEVLHDRLLDWFDDIEGLEPSDVLVAFPDLAVAGPLIDGIFGTAPAGASNERRRIPYRITGLPPSQANPVARALIDWLALTERSVGAPELVEWLRVDAIAARYGIDASALETAQAWLAAAGARRGLRPDEVTAADVPAARHTFADALTRLYLGYALPEGGAPVAEWLPIEGANGSDAELLGRLTRFVDDIDAFAERIASPRTARAWGDLLLDALERFFDAGVAFTDVLSDVRGAIDALVVAMDEGAGATEVSAAVIRTALTDTLDDPARGGVPWGGVTFSSLTSLRGLPYRVVCLLGMDDGMLPSLTRADEFDLMARFSRLGDRQRRDDERNLFLDLMLAARDRFMIAYTGRSIRDNAVLPPAALIDELLDYLAKSVAGKHAAPEALEAARASFVFEHPLQPYAPDYFNEEGRLFTYEPERAELARALESGKTQPVAPFFSAPLPREDDVQTVAFDDFVRFWRHPARALLRDRLGIALFDAEAELDDTEPFELGFSGRDALAARVLPALLEAADDNDRTARERARRVARASPEMPGGATGGVWQARELHALGHLAERVRASTAAGIERLPFSLDLTPRWPHPHDQDDVALFGAHDDALVDLRPMTLVGTLNALTPQGQVIYRYDAPRARDYLSAWLAHLAYCAALPDGPRRTVWHGRGSQAADFELAPVADPLAHLAALAALYRAGRRMPLRFFPKSAWLKVKEGDAKAQGAWESERTRAESDDPVLRIAFRGANLALDDAFAAIARIVFEPLVQHLRSGA